MRKHNKKFATRWRRTRNADGKVDRSNFPQMMAHRFANDKGIQLFSNSLLGRMIASVIPKKEVPVEDTPAPGAA